MPDHSSAALSSHRTLWFAGTALAIVATIVLALVGPGGESVCLVRATTGVSCPGCGMTRASAALLRGDWGAMWELHPLTPFVAAEGVGLWVAWGWIVFVRRSRVNETLLFYVLIGNFVVFVLVWLARLMSGSLPP